MLYNIMSTSYASCLMEMPDVVPLRLLVTTGRPVSKAQSNSTVGPNTKPSLEGCSGEDEATVGSTKFIRNDLMRYVRSLRSLDKKMLRVRKLQKHYGLESLAAGCGILDDSDEDIIDLEDARDIIRGTHIDVSETLVQLHGYFGLPNHIEWDIANKRNWFAHEYGTPSATIEGMSETMAGLDDIYDKLLPLFKSAISQIEKILRTDSAWSKPEVQPADFTWEANDDTSPVDCKVGIETPPDASELEAEIENAIRQVEKLSHAKLLSTLLDRCEPLRSAAEVLVRNNSDSENSDDPSQYSDAEQDYEEELSSWPDSQSPVGPCGCDFFNREAWPESPGTGGDKSSLSKDDTTLRPHTPAESCEWDQAGSQIWPGLPDKVGPDNEQHWVPVDTNDTRWQ
ncbi:hypothetical protein BDV96DRAFT_658336 [Lophiotrema nucula]|uniref:Uncharacterized protein n=1 Tax=Lophiotrema nucula TaxID=690887 RepID=A0A6A5Z997_9PLEO|nr:hypothetical protein BDV96DRAFT_658336 [Lophiotrema nucula]